MRHRVRLCEHSTFSRMPGIRAAPPMENSRCARRSAQGSLARAPLTGGCLQPPVFLRLHRVGGGREDDAL